MKRLLVWLSVGAALGTLLGFAVGKGDPRAPLFMAGLCGLLAAAGGCVAGLAGNTKYGVISAARWPIIVGLLAGVVIGGALGATTSFGALMIALFNPDLPPRDFAAVFGALGGGVVGAACGTLLGAAVARRK
jgi:hypothetical protein